MSVWTKELPYFSYDSLACKGSGIVLLDLRFAAALPALREAWNRPLIVTSVCRSPEHNASVGGHVSSLHLTVNTTHKTAGTAAADIAWKDWTKAERLAFAKLAWKHHWAVGLHKQFIHVDMRRIVGLAPAIFLYGTSWTGEFSAADVKY